jgi:aspartate racemase
MKTIAIIGGIGPESTADYYRSSLIPGCTELPLILPATEFGIPFLNTTAIHCASIIDFRHQEAAGY